MTISKNRWGIYIDFSRKINIVLIENLPYMILHSAVAKLVRLRVFTVFKKHQQNHASRSSFCKTLSQLYV